MFDASSAAGTDSPQPICSSPDTWGLVLLQVVPFNEEERSVRGLEVGLCGYSTYN